MFDNRLLCVELDSRSLVCNLLSRLSLLDGSFHKPQAPMLEVCHHTIEGVDGEIIRKYILDNRHDFSLLIFKSFVHDRLPGMGACTIPTLGLIIRVLQLLNDGFALFGCVLVHGVVGEVDRFIDLLCGGLSVDIRNPLND